MTTPERVNTQNSKTPEKVNSLYGYRGDSLGFLKHGSGV